MIIIIYSFIQISVLDRYNFNEPFGQTDKAWSYAGQKSKKQKQKKKLLFDKKKKSF